MSNENLKLVVIDEHANVHDLRNMVRTDRCILTFTRHAGCIFCRDTVRALDMIYDQAKKANIRVICITLGTPNQLAALRALSGFRGELYSELNTRDYKQYHSYIAFRLVRGESVLTEESWNIVKQLESENIFSTPHLAGDEQEWAGDIYQIGGVFVVGPGNQCDYAFRAEYAGQQPDFDQVLRVAQGVEDSVNPKTSAWIKRLASSQLANASSSSSSSTNTTNPASLLASPFHSHAAKHQHLDFIPDFNLNVTESSTSSNQQNEENKAATCDSNTCSIPSASASSSSSSPPSTPKCPVSKASSSDAMSKMECKDGVCKMPSKASASTADVPAESITPVAPKSSFLPSLMSLIVCSAPLGYILKAKGILSQSAATVLIYAALFAFAVLFLYFGYTKKSASAAASINQQSSQPVPVPEPEPVYDGPEIKLLTPHEIDDLVMEKGMMECDCNGLLSNIPMESASTESDCAIQSPPLRGRKRANTWTENTTNEFQEMLCYVREFLARPNPLIGRPGFTCPFIPSALRLNSVFLSVIRTGEETSKDMLVKMIRNFIPKFLALPPNSGTKQMYKAAILILPDVQLQDAPVFIDGVQRELKPEFVKKGLMLGEFHMLNNTPGLRNPNFFPLRTPIPSLAIRFMAASDIVFLATDTYQPEIVSDLLNAYIARFGAKDTKEVLHAKEFLAKLAEKKSEPKQA